MPSSSIDVTGSTGNQHYTLTLNKSGNSWELILFHNEGTMQYGAWGTVSGNISGIGSGSYSTYCDFRNYNSITIASGSCSSYGTLTATFNSNNPSYIASGKTISIYEAQPVVDYDHTLTYDANGGLNPPSSQTVTNRSSASFDITLSSSKPTKDQKIFLGWSTNNIATSPSYYPGTRYTFNSRNITLYAVWGDLYNHTLTYDANGGSNPPSQKIVKNEDQNKFTTTLSTSVPTRSGFVFAGWALSRNAQVATHLPGEEYEFNSVDAKLYAVWTAQRTITLQKTGSGTVMINGQIVTNTITLGYNTNVTVKITPEIPDYYIKSISVNDTPYEFEPTMETISNEGYETPLLENTTLAVEFGYRNTHSINIVDTEYQVEGSGSHRFLDKPVLLARLNSLANFEGWYEIIDGNEFFVSDQNPYTLVMPDRDIYLTLKTGAAIFSDMEIRQFAIQNGDGQVVRLTDYNSHIFLDDPDGFGINNEIESDRYGYSEITTYEKSNMPEPKGTLKFFNEDNASIYTDYYDFARFINRKPLTLWQKVPIQKTDKVFSLPVDLIDLGKTQNTEDGIMPVPITLRGKTFWTLSESHIASYVPDITFYNDSDVEIGIKVTISIEDDEAFDNPLIKFKQNGVEYGAIAIEKNDITKVVLDTRDTGNSLTLYSGDTVIENPFSYIDFSYPDGSTTQFPFPRLKQGFNTIVFNYDGESEDEKIYLVEFDKVYLSV